MQTTPPAPPKKWKMWLAVSLFAFPAIYLLSFIALRLFPHLAPPLRLLIITPFMVAVIIWIVLPLVARLFGRWLAK